MPEFDQKGPSGQGPMTGRRLGRCTKSGASLPNQSVVETEEARPLNQEKIGGPGFGLGRGKGGAGRGLGRQNRRRSGI